jgi:molybdopterin converting factor small subunit
LAGQEVVEVCVAPPATIAELRHEIATQYPGLSGLLPHVMFAVDAEYAGDEAAITAENEIALIPPVSGG